MAAGEKEPSGFWKSLFRKKPSSYAQQQNGKPPPRTIRKANGIDAVPRRTAKANDINAVPRRRRADGARVARSPSRSRRRARFSDPRIASRRFKGKGREDPRDRGLVSLTEWPPRGLAPEDEMTMRHAESLICRGAPIHTGHVKSIPHAPDHYFALYATSTMSPYGGKAAEGDAVDLHSVMAELMTMRLQGRRAARLPWETLEQPSLAFSYGSLPGTVTLNQWLALSSSMPNAIPLRDPGVPALREVNLVRIFRRLKEIEMGGNENDSAMHRSLYKHFLRDSDRLFSLQKTLDRQITDLIQVLSKPEWIDFTNPKNQVVTRFIFDRGYLNHELYQRFFHQLLLSLELDLRINSRKHSEWAKERLLSQIPPSIQWNIALARRWMKFIRIDGYGMTADQVKLRYRLRKRQVKVLEKFASTMKWPNLDETLDKLRQRNADTSVDAASSDAMAFFSGLVLPGPTYPFLIMNTLIDIDPDKATDDLALLTHLYPSCGFQHRNSYTYWTATCIVGKVLAPTCKLAAGWIGPGRPTSDLARSQIARIRSRRARQQLTLDDVTSMAERSDPLGPPADTIPVGDYKLITVDPDDVVDTVRIERLGFQPCPARFEDAGPQWFDATVQFAMDGMSWPLRLAYDVSFVAAWPCKGGSHPLFFDYAYTMIRVDRIVGVHDWGGVYGVQLPENGGVGVQEREEDEERVLVVEAFGVRDNEVLARAWCAHWGLGAVVANVRKTCVACAVREAYAATLTVVILIDGQNTVDEELI